MSRYRIGIPTIAAAGAFAAAGAAFAGAHTWDVSEVFSTADGSVQFIELFEVAGGANEWHVGGLKVTSESTGNEFTFPANLVAPPTNKRILLATQSFADLDGAPTPDYIIPADFFAVGGDTIRYHVYDTWVISAGAVPTDCVNSLNRTGGVGLNTPTNDLGATGQVDAWAQADSDVNGDRVVDTADLGIVISGFGSPGPFGDVNGDGIIDTADLGTLISAFGSSCP